MNIVHIYYNFSHILQVMNFSYISYIYTIVGDGLEIESKTQVILTGNLKSTGLNFK